METAEIRHKRPGLRPLYVQVKELLLESLATNRWQAGDMLPSESYLAQELGVSPGTVRKALDEMTAQNLVVRRQGIGTFVATHTPERALFHFFHIARSDGTRVRPLSRVLSCRKRRANDRERERLQLPKKAEVIQITRVRSLGGSPAILERIALPVLLFKDLESCPEDDLPNTLYRYLQERYGVSITRADEQLRAVIADSDDAEHLGLLKGSALLEIERLAFDLREIPVEWRISRLSTEHFHYINSIE